MCYVGRAMPDSDLKFLNPPIVESIFDIECDFHPGFQLSGFQEEAAQLFKDTYSKARKVMFQTHQFKYGKDSPPQQTVMEGGIQALQHFTEDEKQLVQIRNSGYSFNRLAPYTSLDDYLPEIEKTWGLFVELVNPIQIRAIRLRYINRILLPLESGGVQLDSYLKMAPQLPEEDSFSLTGFLNQYQAEDLETGSQVNIVLTAQPKEGNILPVIFDSTVLAPTQSRPDDWESIKGKILVLRELKNRIFLKALTQKCLDLFQQP